MVFVDEVEIDVTAGDGGNGALSFRREKFVPRGGPDGGNGGRGGDVVIAVDGMLGTLADLRYKRKYRAQRGGDGGPNNKHGKDGRPLEIAVPPGTLVYDRVSGERLADLTSPGETVMGATGGAGGRGNSSFATATERTPRFAENGAPGESRSLRLELKLLADVGLVGYPNVGKSTLISKVSAAKPKIADYPFTTLAPNLGVVRIEEGRSFVVADMPGLIEGAHLGAGLGRQFLRHIERTSVIAHILDVSGLTGRDPLEDFEKINDELRLFSGKLAALPQVVVLNKMDMPGASAVAEAAEADLAKKGLAVLRISALNGEGVSALIYAVGEIVDKSRARVPAEAPEEVALYTVPPPEAPLAVERVGDHDYVVSGRDVERIVAMTDLNNEYALRRLHRRLERMGVNRELKSMGAQDGDTVRIGSAELEYKEEDIEG